MSATNSVCTGSWLCKGNVCFSAEAVLVAAFSHFESALKLAAKICLITVIVLSSPNCGGNSSPSGPSSPQIASGRYVLTLLGFDISSDPDYPACTGLGQPRAGAELKSDENAAPNGQEWEGNLSDPKPR